MDRERFQPVVITLHPGQGDYWEQSIEKLGIPLYKVPRYKNRLWRLHKIIRILRQPQTDLIHGWHTFASPYAGMSAKVLGAKSLGGIRSSIQALDQSWETHLTRLLCDAIVSNSLTTAQAYRAKLRRKKQGVYTVQNAINTSFANRDTARNYLINAFNLPMDAIWVASIGRMYPLKRFDLLIHLAEKIKSTTTKVHFVLIGDGPEKPAMESQSQDLGLQDLVTFTGEVPLVSRWMKGFDIFCFPSTDEGMPNVIMEAAAAGLPILAWRYPFIEELLVNGEMALLVQPGDLEGMGKALRTLIHNPQLRQQLGGAAQSHVNNNFSVERYIQEMTAIYDSLLSSKSDLNT